MHQLPISCAWRKLCWCLATHGGQCSRAWLCVTLAGQGPAHLCMYRGWGLERAEGGSAGGGGGGVQGGNAHHAVHGRVRGQVVHQHDAVVSLQQPVAAPLQGRAGKGKLLLRP